MLVVRTHHQHSFPRTFQGGGGREVKLLFLCNPAWFPTFCRRPKKWVIFLHKWKKWVIFFRTMEKVSHYFRFKHVLSRVLQRNGEHVKSHFFGQMKKVSHCFTYITRNGNTWVKIIYSNCFFDVQSYVCWKYFNVHFIYLHFWILSIMLVGVATIKHAVRARIVGVGWSTTGCPTAVNSALPSKMVDKNVDSLGLPWPLESSAMQTAPVHRICSWHASLLDLSALTMQSVAVWGVHVPVKVAAVLGLVVSDTERFTSASLNSGSIRRRLPPGPLNWRALFSGSASSRASTPQSQ